MIQIQKVTVAQAVQSQSKEGGWICPDCKYYEGGCKCLKNMFIAFTGAYTKDCSEFVNKNNNS